MNCVSALIGNLLVQTRNLDSRLIAVLATLWFSGQLTLESGKFLLGARQALRIVEALVVR